MDNNFRIPRETLKPIKQRPVSSNLSGVKSQVGQQNDFSRILQQKIDSSELKFSAHAQKRMWANGVKLNANQITELEHAVKKVEQKGGKESLIVLDDLAFVVSINNRTVITAINQDRLKENVFTNIDSAVISFQSRPDLKRGPQPY